MLHGETAACFQDVKKADYVRIYVCTRVFYAISDAGLRRKVYHRIRRKFRKRSVYGVLIGYVGLDKSKFRAFAKLFKAHVLKPHVVIIVHVIHADDAHSRLHQRKRRMKPDKTACTGDKYSHVFHLPIE